MPTPIIDPMPSAPEPTNPRAVFSARSFAFFAAMAGFITQVNAALAWVADQLAAIAGYAAVTTTASADAVAAASAAAASAGATKWQVDTVYADGAVVWSPISYQTYRRMGAGSGGADPSDNPAAWMPQDREAVGAVISVNANATAARFCTYELGTAALTLTLPATAARGDWVGVIPPTATAGAQTVGRNGHVLLDAAEDMDIDVTVPFRLVYISPARGWVMAA